MTHKLKETINYNIENDDYYDVKTKLVNISHKCLKDKKQTADISFHGKKFTTYCALNYLAKIIDPSSVGEFYDNIDVVYEFLTKKITNNNEVKFNRLIKTILNYDNPTNTLNIVADFIRNTDNTDEISTTLDKFRNEPTMNDNDVEDFLKRIKFLGYREYEKSFYGDHFEKFSTKLDFTSNDDISVFNLVNGVFSGNFTVDDVVDRIYKRITSYNSKDLIKADLRCVKNLFHGDKLIIEEGDLIEVKKLEHSSDSYLSEFMCLYKRSTLPDYVYESKFLNTYNVIIDGVYNLLKNNQKILDDIKNNLLGIFYDKKIFIHKDNIEFYWSNKGRNPCFKDHRLSIRYKLNSPNVKMYRYNNTSELEEIDSSIIMFKTEKNICPILQKNIISSMNESIFILNEGRIDDARKRFPNHLEEVFDFFIKNDPSGNQKYLMWFLKNVRSEYKVHNLHQTLVDLVKFFHEHQEMFKEKDIYKYNIIDLDLAVKEKIKEKQYKKEKTVIYKDDEWFVVSPHSWEASCYYGAGTKWCTTSKHTDVHWKKYSRRSTFFYIINRLKPITDPLYKVAYRRIGTNNKYELWNAEDIEFSKNEVGLRWFDSLPSDMKLKMDKYHEVNVPKIDNNNIIDNDPRAYVLNQSIGSDDIHYTDLTLFNMPIYDVEGYMYVVGDRFEMDEALYNSFNILDDFELLDYDYYGKYLFLHNKEEFVESEVENYVDDLSISELINYYNAEDIFDENENEIKKLLNKISNTKNQEELNNLKEDLELLKKRKDKIIEESKDSFIKQSTKEWESCLEYGVYGCLVNNKGWFSDVFGLYKSGLVFLDRENLIDKLVDESGYEYIAYEYGFDEETDDEGQSWFIFQTDQV